MIWILDGYNIIHAHPELEKRMEISLEHARKHLITVCENLVRSRGDFQKIFIVFDGRSEYSDLEKHHTDGLEVVYTETNEDADDRIIEILGRLGSRKQTCVVSNDNYVLNHARVYGAQKVNVRDFFEIKDRQRNQQQASKHKEHPPIKISGASADNITKEYKKHLGIE